MIDKMKGDGLGMVRECELEARLSSCILLSNYRITWLSEAHLLPTTQTWCATMSLIYVLPAYSTPNI